MGKPPGPTKWVSDGYWIMIEPLGIGPHSVYIRAEKPNLWSEVTYHIVVTDMLVKVIAHYMHELQRDAAKKKMSTIKKTDAFLFGMVDRSDILNLEKEGLSMQILEDQPEFRAVLPSETRREDVCEDIRYLADQTKPNTFIKRMAPRTCH
jgi:hypothetical protein